MTEKKLYGIPLNTRMYHKSERFITERTLCDVFYALERETGANLQMPNNNRTDLLTWVTKQGRLSKRISNYLHNELDIKLTPKALKSISDILSKNVPTSNEIYWDIVDEISWNRGTFESEDSCFWTVKSMAKDYMNESPDFYALRVFRHNKKGKSGLDSLGKLIPDKGWERNLDPLGRCLVIDAKDNNLVLFNAYHYQLVTFGDIISTILGLPTQAVTLVNNESSHGHLWINGSLGLWVGDSPPPDDEDEAVDFKFSIGGKCQCCDRELGDDSDYYNTQDGHTCWSCTEEYYVRSCWSCDHRIHRDNTHNVYHIRHNQRIDEVCVCDECFYDIAVPCDECGDSFVDDVRPPGVTQLGASYMCPSCTEQKEEQEEESESNDN